jgi:hypothetical protein
MHYVHLVARPQVTLNKKVYTFCRRFVRYGSVLLRLFFTRFCVQKQTKETHQYSGRGTIIVSFVLIWLEYLKIFFCFYHECRRLVNTTSTVGCSPLRVWKKRKHHLFFLAFTLKLRNFWRHRYEFGLFFRSRVQITVRRRYVLLSNYGIPSQIRLKSLFSYSFPFIMPLPFCHSTLYNLR